jgi:hypothetical protein
LRITHPYHPWFDREFELIIYRQAWGEDRVYFHEESERLVALPAAWTDVIPLDPIVVLGRGRSPCRAEDLWQLVQLLRQRGRVVV